MNKHVDYIWAMLQRVRGAASIRNTCQMVLYALLLKHNDMNPGFQERFYSYFYSSGMRMYDVINILRRYEEEYYKLDKGVLRDAFNKLANYMKEDTIKIIFQVVGQIEFESTDELYDTAEELICKAAEKSGREYAGYSTNPTVANLEAGLLACESSMTLYDGFCGTGISVNRIAKKDTKIFMQDIDLDTVSIAVILCILGDKNICAAGCGDALWNVDHDLEFDRVIAEPPLGVKYGKDYIEYMFQNEQLPDKNVDGESLAVFHVLDFLKSDGLATVLLPPGFLFRGGKALNTRKLLLEMNVLDAIVELPEGCLPGTYIPAVILMLKKNRGTNDILMIDAKGLFKREKRGMALITDEAIEKVVQTYRERAVIDGFSAAPTLEAIADADYGLSVAKYVTAPIEVLEKESIADLLAKYKEKQSQLLDVEKELNSLRDRYFV